MKYDVQRGVEFVKRLRKSLKMRQTESTTQLLRRLSPQGLARVKREVEAMVRQLSLRAVNKNLKRLFWMSGVLYMLDGICGAIKM